MQFLLAIGAARREPVEFVELGNGDVLTKMAFTIKTQTPESVLSEILRSEQEGSEPAAVEPPPIPAAANADHAALFPPADVGERVAAWNRAHPIGSKLRSTVLDYSVLETKTEAVVLFGHRAAVYMKGYNGYFDLEELAPA